MARATDEPIEAHSHTHMLPDAEWAQVVKDAQRIRAEAEQEAK